MAAQLKVNDFLERNKSVTTPLSPPSIGMIRNKAKAAGGNPSVIIITCSDPRVIPEEYFNLKRGEAAIIRNAGGRVSDAFRSLYTLNAIVNIGVIMVIHHTDCGTTLVQDEEVRESLRGIAPDHVHEIEGMHFGEIKDVDESIREDIALLKASPFLRNDIDVQGYHLDIENSQLTRVE